jgi:DNA-binding response OmpR family regulator
MHKGLILDFPNQIVLLNDVELDLSKKEFSVLVYMLKHDRFISRKELYKKV